MKMKKTPIIDAPVDVIVSTLTASATDVIVPFAPVSVMVTLEFATAIAFIFRFRVSTPI